MRPARIPKTIAKPAPKPQPWLRDRNHLAFVRTLGCIICAKTPAEAAHIRKGTDGGMGVKPGDKFTVPLCAEHHIQQHRVGELSFYAKLGVDPTDLALRLWTVSGNYKAGRRLIFRTQQRIILKRGVK